MTSPWRGRRVLVTGHTGFKGAWLCEWLLSDGAEVWGLALPQAPSLHDDLGLGERMAGALADIRDLEAVRAVLARARPEAVFHLAAQSLVRASYADPLATFATNVQGTANLIEAARTTPSVRAIVCVTSDKCYRNTGSGRPFTEADPLGGHDPYSASKAAAEIVAESYRVALLAPAGGPRLATARAGNVIGGGDRAADRLIPDLVHAWTAGERPRVRNPEAIRPWQHVLEPLRGYLRLGLGLLEGEDVEGAWNLGPSEESAVSVAGLVQRFARAWGDGATEPRVEASPLAEAPVLRLDSAKAAGRLGWRPVLSLDEALEMTAQWWRAFMVRPSEIGEVTRAQIARYEERATSGYASR